MIISSDFFKDEIRCGFYIPTAIKQTWAASISVLAEIERICLKYNIEYFADWGTLIGTVRHGGFVPWDDDLDICMKRKDYIRFRQVADSELPPEYCIHDYERQENHWLFIARVCNSKHISFDKSHLDKYHNYPYIGSIDIFVQDYMYQDSEKEKERCESIKYLLALAEAIRDETIKRDSLVSNLTDIKNRYGVKISLDQSPRDISIAIYKLIERRMSEVKEEDSDRLVQIFPWGLKGAKGLPKSYYEHTVRLPYEFTTMPVPQCYNKVLRDRYGDYLKLHKVWSGHDYPAFEGQRANLQAVADFELPEYRFEPAILERSVVSEENSIQTISIKFIDGLKEKHADLERLLNVINDFSTEQSVDVVNDLSSGDISLIEKTHDLLVKCQQAAVDFGGFLEVVKGEETASVKDVIQVLEEYCDKVYTLYTDLTAKESASYVQTDINAQDINICLKRIYETVKTNILTRNNILFVADGTGRLFELLSYIRDESKCPDNDLFITVAPSFFKDIYGNILAGDEEIDASIEQIKDVYMYLDTSELNIKKIRVLCWDKVDVEALRPARIYYQNPYDEQNPCLTVPTHLYASAMKTFTDRMIYIAPITDEFDQQDINDVYNMKHYVTAPGVIKADRIYVQSEHMRNMYIWKLTDFSNEDTKKIWEEKIEIRKGLQVDKNPIKSEKKRLLYVKGLNEKYEHDADSLAKAFKDRDEIFELYKDKIDVKRIDYPTDAHIDVNDHDVYYGSPSPLVLEFTRAGKPVMIADFDIKDN